MTDTTHIHSLRDCAMRLANIECPGDGLEWHLNENITAQVHGENCPGGCRGTGAMFPKLRVHRDHSANCFCHPVPDLASLLDMAWPVLNSKKRTALMLLLRDAISYGEDPTEAVYSILCGYMEIER